MKAKKWLRVLVLKCEDIYSKKSWKFIIKESLIFCEILFKVAYLFKWEYIQGQFYQESPEGAKPSDV